MKAVIQKYLDRGLRPVPVWGVKDGHCQCGGRDIGPSEHGKTGNGIGKHPIDPERWKDTDWAARDFPDGCNVALQMGKQKNGKWLIALDVDGDVQLEEWLGELPSTLTALTGRGFHMIFETAPFAPFGNWRDAWGTRDDVLGYKPGYAGALDIRFARGAIVAPPSLHRNGSRYQWFADDEIASLPDEAMRRILSRRRARGLPVAVRWDRKGKRP